jgi:NAD(P)-dependent dehydrogenase (short-subunit alcohol dehydrogenase family)
MSATALENVDKEPVSWLTSVSCPSTTPILYSFHWKPLSMRPVQVVGQPEDVAGLVSYLASKEAHFVTGRYIVRCSGRCFLTLPRPGQCVSSTIPFFLTG